MSRSDERLSEDNNEGMMRRTTNAIPPSSNLLSRLEAFLPKIQAANEALPTEGETARVDIDLESENDDDDSDDNSDDSNEEDGDERDKNETGVKRKEAKCTEATIQIQFAVGNVDENPMIKLMADDADSLGDANGGSEADAEESTDRDPSDVARESLIVGMLSESEKKSLPENKRKRPLISEL